MTSEVSRVRHLLHNYLYDSKCKASAHDSAEGVQRRRDKTSSWSQSIMGLVVGVLQVATWNNVDECGSSSNIALIAVSVALSFLAAGIGITRGVWRFSAKEAAHHTTAGNYADVVSDIELFLTGDMSDLQLVRHFVELIHERLDIHDASAAAIGPKYIHEAKRGIPQPKISPFVSATANCKTQGQIRERIRYTTRYDLKEATELTDLEIDVKEKM